MEAAKANMQQVFVHFGLTNSYHFEFENMTQTRQWHGGSEWINANRARPIRLTRVMKGPFPQRRSSGSP